MMLGACIEELALMLPAGRTPSGLSCDSLSRSARFPSVVGELALMLPAGRTPFVGELALPSVARWPAGAAAKADIVNPPKADEVRMKRVMLRRFMVTGSMVKPQASDQN